MIFYHLYLVWLEHAVCMCLSGGESKPIAKMNGKKSPLIGKKSPLIGKKSPLDRKLESEESSSSDSSANSKNKGLEFH